MTDKTLDAALSYARMGWYVFPCGTDKRPVITSTGKPLAWGKWASKDPDIVRRMWTRYPQSNIGLACKPSKLIVLDVDDKNNVDGLTTWMALKKRIGLDILETRNIPAAHTPSGGLHLFWSAENCPDIGNSAGKLGPGLDVRGGGAGDGGYVLLAPSVTPTGCYRWLKTNSPFDSHVKLLPFPQVLTDLLRAPKQTPPSWRDKLQNVRQRGCRNSYSGAALAGEAARVAGAPAGTRNTTLNTAAYSLARLVAAGSLDRQVAGDVLLSAGRAAGLGENETRATIVSAFKARGVV